jgi:hypothetical protein
VSVSAPDPTNELVEVPPPWELLWAETESAQVPAPPPWKRTLAKA